MRRCHCAHVIFWNVVFFEWGCHCAHVFMRGQILFGRWLHRSAHVLFLWGVEILLFWWFHATHVSWRRCGIALGGRGHCAHVLVWREVTDVRWVHRGLQGVLWDNVETVLLLRVVVKVQVRLFVIRARRRVLGDLRFELSPGLTLPTRWRRRRKVGLLGRSVSAVRRRRR